MTRPLIRGLVVLLAVLGPLACSPSQLIRRLVPDSSRPGRRPAARRQLVYAEALPARGGGPVWVLLDSATVYRVEPADGSVRVSPRQSHLPAPREVGSLYGDGLVIQPRITGEYRIDTWGSQEGIVEVRIWSDEADQAERRCVAERRGRGCVGDAWAHGRKPLGFWLMFVAVPVGVLGLKLEHLWWR